jgi:putative restriction endonuclease
MKANAKRWSEDEAKQALHLYFQLPFGQFTQGNKSVIALADLLGRTPSSVAMKLSNFASLDPEIRASGRKGLEGASALDRLVWKEYSSDFEALVNTVEAVQAVELVILEGKDVQTVTNRRVGQSFFRNVVLESYQQRCCISGIDNRAFLVASHIVPWRDDKQNRLNPQNGLCLSSLHDKAFDQGLLTLDEDLRVVLSSQLKKSAASFSRQSFDVFEGRKILAPVRYQPDQQFLEHHRQNIFSDSKPS